MYSLFQHSIRYELNKQQHQIEVLNSSDSSNKKIEESVQRLEEESSNMNSRVQSTGFRLNQTRCNIV